MEHVKNALQNITNEWMPRSVDSDFTFRMDLMDVSIGRISKKNFHKKFHIRTKDEGTELEIEIMRG